MSNEKGAKFIEESFEANDGLLEEIEYLEEGDIFEFIEANRIILISNRKYGFKAISFHYPVVIDFDNGKLRLGSPIVALYLALQRCIHKPDLTSL
jgi:hypothetical protein